MKRVPKYITYLFVIWALILIMAVLVTFNTTSIEKCRYYDEKVQAAELVSECQERIKLYKIANGMTVSKNDINNTGLLGERYTILTTTTGNLESKRTSLNPDFAAVFIDMFKEAGVKKGDQVLALFSGSFPSLNLAVMCAAQVFDLDICIMASIGSSSYGANDPSFTFYDMAEYLYNEGVLTNRINYVSLGGAGDIASDLDDNDSFAEVKTNIISRIEANGTNFIYEDDYVKNIEYRLKVINEEVPNMKMLINVGGNIIGMGRDTDSFSGSTGLIIPSQVKLEMKKITDKVGLIDRFLNDGIPVIHMLNIKGIALEYDLPYDPVGFSEIGTEEVYYETNYSTVIPIIALGVSVIFLGYLLFLRKKGTYL